MKKQEVDLKLFKAGVHANTLSCKKGVWMVRRGFFYSHGMTSRDLADKVEKAGFSVIAHGEVWKPFRGGASVAQQSHWWVKFSI